MAYTMLQKLCKWIQDCSAILWWSRNKRNAGSCWLKRLTSFKLCTTTPNDIQQHATGCANRRKMCHLTMLVNVGQQCCLCLHRALQLGGDWWINLFFWKHCRHRGVHVLLPFIYSRVWYWVSAPVVDNNLKNRNPVAAV